MAQHVAIGALDAGLHHAGGKQHQRHRAGQMQQDDGAAHAGPRSQTAASSADAMTEKGKMAVRIMVIAKTDTTGILLAG